MTSEELKRIKKDIANLSKDDLKQRMIHLQKLATGEYQGPPVGYPSIDQTWLKYYATEDLLADYTDQSFYEFMYNHNKNNLDSIALKYLSLNITFGQLFEQIENTAKSLAAMGVKKGDTVGICAPTTPETIYLLYAINKIGAVANLIDVRKKNDDLKYCLNISDEKVKPVKLLFVYDGQYDRINSFLDETSVEKVVTISPLQSLPKAVRFAYNPKLYLNSISGNKSYKNYDEFIYSGNNVENVETVPYEKGRISFIEYTSGSTDKPKAISLNDSTGNHRVFQYMHNGMKYDKGDTYLNIIPIFLAFGAFVGIHLPLSMGMTDELIPSFDAKKIYSYFAKSKAKHMTLTPASFVKLVYDKKFKKLNLSRMRTLGCGGDGFNATSEEYVVESLEKQGCKVPLNNGYGCSEIGAPFCTQKNNIAKYGSVGIPLPGNNIIIFRHNTLEEAPVNTIGDICMVVDYPMLGYISREDLSDLVMIPLEDGRIGIRLEDAGYVDSDGNVFVKGRFCDAFYKDGEYIWPVDIENTLMKSGMVKMCCIVPTNDIQYEGKMLIVPNDNFNLEKMEKYIKTYLTCYNLNILFKFVDQITLTGSGKIDRRKIKLYTK